MHNIHFEDVTEKIQFYMRVFIGCKNGWIEHPTILRNLTTMGILNHIILHLNL